MDCVVPGVAELDMTEQFSLSLVFYTVLKYFMLYIYVSFSYSLLGNFISFQNRTQQKNNYHLALQESLIFFVHENLLMCQ